MNKSADQQAEVFLLKAKDAEAMGTPVEDGFLVHKGGLARKEIAPSARDSVSPVRRRLISEGVLKDEGAQLRFTRDYPFGSPSGAAAAVLGRSANGWTEWKLADGRTLSEAKRVARGQGEPMLSEAKRQQIVEMSQELISKGQLYSDAQLRKYYDRFRERFGPDALQALDGESLLTLMHDHSNRDSLVYWLEYKNDEEFDTRSFGGIAGGSALNFGVFRRAETGTWAAPGKGHRPKDISVEEAVELARAHRDQLLKGIQILESLPDDASDEDYAQLQDQMDELAPDVSKRAWGHKYFSLLYPGKLDDFHNPGLQRFHIMKLLQIPPSGDGRYICTARFTAAAKEVGLPMSQLTGVLNAVHGKWHRYWRIGTRSATSGTSYWPMMRDHGCVAAGWADLGDLSWVQANKASREKLKKLFHEKHPSSASAEGRAAREYLNFAATISEGDIVWAADGARVLGIGRITGEYHFDPAVDFAHRRPVEWLSLDECKMPVTEGLQSTVRELGKHNENIVETERRIQEGAGLETAGRVSTLKKPVRLDGIPGRIQAVLDRKSQVILYGPPGTGKTFWAERAANDLAAIAAFGRQFEELDDAAKRTVTGDGTTSGLVRLCCFHPAYGYEDFIEGYRPAAVDGQLTFELRPGLFKKLCRDAEAAPDRKFYLVVDEINRGDIPRIFGELLTTLEKDKRGKRIILPVSQEAFTIPRNVLVIGTMNTADRSISLLDAALRRRFGFIEMMPNGSVLRDSQVNGIPLRAWLDALNQRIREHVGRDARNLQIGHSYLMQGGSPIKEIAVLKRAIRDDIIPLLEEYCYEDYGTLTRILGEGLVDPEAQLVRHDLFDEGQEQELVDVLLSPFSDITQSNEALSAEESAIGDEGDEDDGVDEE
ncbi:DUF4357 domain-containing protein [Candidatus Laterigemmans baculatus]|uniref:DUF4357 domain-containing protein n=1 Tax=Candidatus Laterigemmans baculatus TaxID=2770505 RepID=UPI0013DBA6F9|nr:DUF4357 domain-containing protein [Candidatus Laterigemmans baculatus]